MFEKRFLSFTGGGLNGRPHCSCFCKKLEQLSHYLLHLAYLVKLEPRQVVDDIHRLDTDIDHAQEQVKDVPGIFYVDDRNLFLAIKNSRAWQCRRT